MRIHCFFFGLKYVDWYLIFPIANKVESFIDLFYHFVKEITQYNNHHRTPMKHSFPYTAAFVCPLCHVLCVSVSLISFKYFLNDISSLCQHERVFAMIKWFFFLIKFFFLITSSRSIFIIKYSSNKKNFLVVSSSTTLSCVSFSCLGCSIVSLMIRVKAEKVIID